MKNYCVFGITILFLTFSTIVNGQVERWDFKDTLQAKTCKQKTIKNPKFKKLIKKEKIKAFPVNKNEEFPNLYLDYRNGNYFVAHEQNDRKKMTYLYEGFNPVKTLWKPGSTFFMTDFTKDSVQEIGVFWKIAKRTNSEWGHSSSEIIGLVILDPVEGETLANISLSVCGSGWNMCTGKSHSGCSYQLTFEMINDFLVFKINSKFWKGTNKVYFKHDGESFVKVDSSDIY